MKLVLDERVKHRIVGLTVLLSIAAIFLPAILKKSNQSFDSMSRVAVRLPARPAMPTVKQVEAEKLFQTVKVAKVVLPKPAVVAEPIKIAKAASLEPMVSVETPIQVSESKLPALPQEIGKKKPVERVKTAATLPVIVQTRARKPVPVVRSGYAVQVANFASLQNAQTLVSKLHLRGFSASYVTIRTARGAPNYRVLVGQSAKREDVLRVQGRLANSMQLRGFVVPANVG